mmetsp:Transcript_50851/g.158910  ORF Transcript_50851/g.158910 Transcript_50851/m.158910 type:complete len:270 (-) Transcript_50851:471-1280(-)
MSLQLSLPPSSWIDPDTCERRLASGSDPMTLEQHLCFLQEFLHHPSMRLVVDLVEELGRLLKTRDRVLPPTILYALEPQLLPTLRSLQRVVCRYVLIAQQHNAGVLFLKLHAETKALRERRRLKVADGDLGSVDHSLLRVHRAPQSLPLLECRRVAVGVEYGDDDVSLVERGVGGAAIAPVAVVHVSHTAVVPRLPHSLRRHPAVFLAHIRAEEPDLDLTCLGEERRVLLLPHKDLELVHPCGENLPACHQRAVPDDAVHVVLHQHVPC